MASTSSTAGAPVSSSARAARFAAPTTTALAAKVASAVAVVTTTSTCRSAGRRASESAARPSARRPRASATAPNRAATRRSAAGAEEPDRERQEHRRQQGRGPLDVARDEPAQGDDRHHDHDHVENPEASPGDRRHPTQEGRHRFTQHRTGRQVDGDEAGDDGHRHGCQQRPAQLERDARRQDHATDEVADEQRDTDAERDAQQHGHRQLGHDESAAALTAATAQPGERDLGPALLDGGVGDERQHRHASRASWASRSGTSVRTMERPEAIEATRSGHRCRDGDALLGATQAGERRADLRDARQGDLGPVERVLDRHGGLRPSRGERALAGDEVVHGGDDRGPPGEREAGLAVDLGAQPVPRVGLRAVDTGHGERHGRRRLVPGIGRRRVGDVEDLPLRPVPDLGVRRRDEHLSGGLRAPATREVEVRADVVAGDETHRRGLQPRARLDLRDGRGHPDPVPEPGQRLRWHGGRQVCRGGLRVGDGARRSQQHGRVGGLALDEARPEQTLLERAHEHRREHGARRHQCRDEDQGHRLAPAVANGRPGRRDPSERVSHRRVRRLTPPPDEARRGGDPATAES